MTFAEIFIVQCLLSIVMLSLMLLVNRFVDDTYWHSNLGNISVVFILSLIPAGGVLVSVLMSSIFAYALLNNLFGKKLKYIGTTMQYVPFRKRRTCNETM